MNLRVNPVASAGISAKTKAKSDVNTPHAEQADRSVQERDRSAIKNRGQESELSLEHAASGMPRLSSQALSVDPLAPSLEQLKQRMTSGSIDSGRTWGDYQHPEKAEFNFGHHAVDGKLWNVTEGGDVVWADNGRKVSWNQVNLMPEGQRNAFFQLAGMEPVPPREAIPNNTSLMDPPGATGSQGADRQVKLDAIRAKLGPEDSALLDSLGTKLDDRDLASQGTLLDQLSRLATDGVSEDLSRNGISSQDVLSQLVRELADPTLIQQGNRGTCASTSVEILMAKEHPAELARLATDLVQAGSTNLASGEALGLNQTGLSRSNGQMNGTTDHRSDLDRLFQASLMSLSSSGAYDNVTDRFQNGQKAGLTQSDVAHILNGVTGSQGSYQVISRTDPQIFDRIAAATAAGHEVLVGLVNGNLGHEMVVNKVENGMVYLRDPQGGMDRAGRVIHDTEVDGNGKFLASNDNGNIIMTMETFKRVLGTASVPEG